MKNLSINETEQHIKNLISSTKNENKKIRLEALLIKKQNPRWSMSKVAEALQANRRTIERWLSFYEEGGIKKLCIVKRAGSRLRKTLNTEQQNGLKAAIEQGAVKSYQDARFWIFKECGIAMQYKNATMFVSKQMAINLSNR